MTTRGPEDRERFVRKEETGVLSPRREGEDERSAKVVAGGSITEAVCGAATVVLAIIALAGVAPGYVASIAAIVFGAALVAHGGAVAARLRELSRETSPTEWDTRVELGGGSGAELIGGIATIVLGILGLIGVATAALVPIAVIVSGGTLLLGSAATADLGTMGASTHHRSMAESARHASAAAAGLQSLSGAAAVVLGILALVGIDAAVLALVGFLVLGASVLLSGTAVSTRMAAVMRR